MTAGQSQIRTSVLGSATMQPPERTHYCRDASSLDPDGVLECLPGHDLRRAHVLAGERNDALTRALGGEVAARVGSR